MVQLLLSILCNLLQVPVNIAYFITTECDKIVQYFSKSTDLKTRILSVCILCYLKVRLTVDRSHLEVTNEDAEFMVNLILASISEGGISLRPISLLRALHAVVKVSETNACKFISGGLVSIISDLVATCDKDIQKEVLLILWTVASYSSLKSEVNLSDIVNSLEDNYDLTTLSMCALWDINEQSQGKFSH